MKKIYYLFFFSFIFLISFNVKAEENMGTFVLKSGLNSNKVIAVNNNNVELQTYNNLDTQKWDIFKENNYYYIKSHADNNLVMDVNCAINRNGTNIQVYQLNRSIAQKWKINGSNNSLFYIVSLLGKNVDISGAGTSDGTNIQLYQNNGTNAQKYYVERISNLDSDIQDGTYIIRNKKNQNNSIDVNGGSSSNYSNVQSYSNNFTWAQLWNIKKENGYYKITSYLNNNKSLDISAGSMTNFSNIQLYDYNGTNAQKFIIDKNTDGTYTIRNISGIRVVDIINGSTSSGANIQLYESNNTDAQKFTFEKSEPVTYLNDAYSVNTVKSQDKLISLNKPVTFNSNRVVVKTNQNANSNKWKFVRTTRDQYKILSGVSSKALDVTNNATSDGTKVQIYSDNGSSAQRWIARKNDNGSISFYGLNSAKALDLAGGSIADGTNVQIYTSNKTSAQQFNLTKTELDPYSVNYEDGTYLIKSTNNNYTLDISGAHKDNNTNVQLYSRNNSKAQYFKLEYLNNNEYIFRSYLNPNITLTMNGNNLVISKYTGSDNQKFFIVDLGNNNINIISKSNGEEISYNTIYNGSNVGTNYNNKTFTLEKANPNLLYGGIDISKHQGNINFNSLKNNIDFAILRAGYGDDSPSQDDQKFFEYARNCNQYNIPFGVYLYSYANNISHAESEARHVVRVLNSAKSQGLIPNMKTQVFFDSEQSGTEGVARNNAIRFCQIVEQNGYSCGIYGSKSWLNNYIRPRDLYSRYEIWVAHYKFVQSNVSYNYAANNKTNYNASPYYLWQYQSDGRLPGINTYVDMNIGYNVLY